MKRVLFLCTANRLRSPTAEQVFATWPDVEVDWAGVSADAVVPVSTEQIEWADIVFVMEKVHRTRLSKRFRRHLGGKRVICLDIPERVRLHGSRAAGAAGRPRRTAPSLNRKQFWTPRRCRS